MTAERERCPTRARWPESPHTTQTLCMTQRRPSSPTRCNITEGTGLSYTLTLAYKHITLHTDTHTHKRTHTRSYIHTSTCSHKDPERLCDCGALRRARGERGCRGSSFLPAAVGHAAAGQSPLEGAVELTEQPQEIPLEYFLMQSVDRVKMGREGC